MWARIIGGLCSLYKTGIRLQVCGSVQEPPGETQVRHRRCQGWSEHKFFVTIIFLSRFASWWAVVFWGHTSDDVSAGTLLTRWRKSTLKIHQERSLIICIRLENQKQTKWMCWFSGMLWEVGRSCGEMCCAALATIINAIKYNRLHKEYMWCIEARSKVPKKWYMLFSDERQ